MTRPQMCERITAPEYLIVPLCRITQWVERPAHPLSSARAKSRPSALGPEAPDELRGARIRRHEPSVQRGQRHDPPDRVGQEQALPLDRLPRIAPLLPFPAELEHPRPADPWQDPQLERGRPQPVAVRPEHVPYGPLGHPPVGRTQQRIVRLGDLRFFCRIHETIALGCLVRILLVRLCRRDHRGPVGRPGLPPPPGGPPAPRPGPPAPLPCLPARP